MSNSNRVLTGAEELRTIVRILNNTREGFNDNYTAEELIQICRMQRASGWDFTPCQWSARQVAESLRGIVPTWDSDEQPTYTTSEG